MPPAYAPLTHHDPSSSSDNDRPSARSLPPPSQQQHPPEHPWTTHRAPPVLVPDPFHSLSLSLSYSRQPHLGSSAPSSPLANDDDQDSDSDSLSEASSVTAHGGASFDLARCKAALGLGDDEDDSDEKGERDRLVEEGAQLDPDSDVEGGQGAGKRAKRARRHRLLLLFLTSLLLLLSFLFLLSLRPSSSLSALSAHPHRFEGKGLKKLTLDELKNGTWWTERVELDWVAEAGDGVFSTRAADGSIVLTNIHANSSRTLVRGEDVVDPRTGSQLQWVTFQLSPDMQYIVFSTDHVKQWRHSSLSTFHLHRISPPRTLTLGPSSSFSSQTLLEESFTKPRTDLVRWAPSGHTLAFVHARDVYVLPGEGVDEAFQEAEGAGAEGNEKGALWERAVRVTEDGGQERFNGVNDWVYEEEIFSSPLALFFSPSSSSSYLAFLTFDSSRVPSYDFPIYNSDLNGWDPAKLGEGGADEYESWVRMRYPKAGYPNPVVEVRLFALSSYLSSSSSSAPSRPTLSSSSPSATPVAPFLSTLRLSNPFDPANSLVTEVVWVAPESVVVRWATRDAGEERVGLFDVSGEPEAEGEEKESVRVGRTVRSVDWVKRDGGWAEASQNIVPLLPLSSSSSSSAARAPLPSYPPGYLDVLPSPAGYNHLAYFSPPDAAEPVWLTQGAWEIDGGALRVDLERGFAYVLAARPSTSRHVLRVALPRSQAALDALRSGREQVTEPTQLTEGLKSKGSGGKGGEEEGMGLYSASFSPGGGVYLLNYEGPEVPWQKLLKVDDPDYSLALTNNAALRALDASYAHADISYSTLSIPDTDPAAAGDGKGTVEVNVMEMRPPLMDVSGRTKYPVLFQVYGGPASQLVTPRWQRDFQHYLCVSLGYIVVRVDPRGTGFRGRKFRTTVRGRLGEVERADVVASARAWSGREYVDEKRVGIWGWSYGGFLTTKVIEANSSVFQLGMAVAPVTDWRYYDSVYTERYMSTPQLNPHGYRNSSVHEMDGFKHAVYALAHGTGDDNVHFQNTANLLDRFTVAGVRDFHLRIFPDSDHSISTRNAYWELMAWLEGILLEHFGVGGRTKQRWKMTAGDRHVE